MISSVRVINRAGYEQIMELGRPEQSGLLIRNISGIGPGAVDLKTTDYASLPGSIYSGSRKPTRNIVFDLVALWKDTVEEARHEIEKIFRIGDSVKIIFYTSERTCYINGIVESNEPEIFSGGDVEGIPVQVSIVCTDPTFYDVNPVTLIWPSQGQAGTHFPLTNNSSSNGYMGYLMNEYKFTIENMGTENVGLHFKFNIIKNINQFKITNYRDNSYMLLKAAGATFMENGDSLLIDTRSGQKSITCKKSDGKVLNLLNCYTPYESTWSSLEPGQNAFVVTVNGQTTTEHSFSKIELEYRPIYWGI